VTWTEISPDLTKNEVDKQGLNGGPLTPENVGAEFYGTLFYIVESPHEAGTIWVGSDDGLLHVTRNNGESWQNVTPGNLNGAQVNSIEISPNDPGTVYIAVSGYKMNDFRPHIYKGTDYGRSWRKIDGDLPDDNFVRVVREDPGRSGLLYAGTEGGMYASFDDGDNWQSLDLNLPPVPITDLTIRQDDLVAATQGRGFWILDDLSIVRQANDGLAQEALHLFTPDPTAMIRGGRSSRANEGSNPPAGAVLSYYISEEQDGPLVIDITDSDGNNVRSFSSEEGDFEKCIVGNMVTRTKREITYPATTKGLNQFAWDMRSKGLNCIDDIKLFAGFGGATVIPGQYKVSVSVGGATSVADLTLLPDPREEAEEEDYRFLADKRRESTNLLNELLDNLAVARKARNQIEALLMDYPDAVDLQDMGNMAIERLTTWENQVTQTQYDALEDEDSMPPMLDVHIRHVLDVIDRAGAPVSAGSLQRLSDLDYLWQDRKSELRSISNTDIAAINDWANENGVGHVSAPGDTP
jgi:hypothetical protein